MSFVYILTNQINQKVYVGQTTKTNPLVRIKRHARRKDLIGRAIRKYGLENFTILCYECVTDDLDNLEKKYITECNSLVPNGYNLESGGNSNKKLAEYTKQKLSILNKGKWSGSKNGMFGKYGPEHPAYGCLRSKETKEKLKVEKLGIKNPMYGKHTSDFQKRQVSEAIKGGDNPRAKKVICVETGEVFNCIDEAQTKYNAKNISAVCRKSRKFAGGLRWEYAVA